MWRVQESKIGQIKSWKIFYQENLTFRICRNPNKYFDLTFYNVNDNSVSKEFKCDVMKANQRVLAFVNDNELFDDIIVHSF